MSYLLIISTRAPYHSSSAIDAYEAALAATNMGVSVKFLFMGDGAYQIENKQAPEQIGHKNLFKKLKALPLFDVEDIYAHVSSMQGTALRTLTDESLSNAKDDKIDISGLEIILCRDAQLSALYANAAQILEF